jgi:hypothetical protein
MKNLFLFVLVFACLQSYSQGWKTVKLDTTVSFQLPAGFQKSKSDSASSFSATTTFGTILIFKSIDNPIVTPDIEKDKHLTDFYNEYIERVKTSSGDGKISGEKDTLIGDLKVKDFTLEIDTGSGAEMRKFRILHANNATYAFEFLFQKMHTEFADEECVKFFNSINVTEGVTRADQYNARAEEGDGGVNPYLVGLAVLAVIALIIYLVIRKKKVVV